MIKFQEIHNSKTDTTENLNTAITSKEIKLVIKKHPKNEMSALMNSAKHLNLN